MLKYLIICPLVFLGGFVDSIAGGGGLITLPAYMLAGLPVHNAIATNKISSMMGTSVATAKYAKNGYLPWKVAPFLVGGALSGAAIGAKLSLMLDEHIFKILMLFILPLTLFYVLKNKNMEEDPEPYPFGKTTIIALIVAFVIGGYDGFYGPGAGTFMILGLNALVHLNLNASNGGAKVINLCTNISSMIVYVLSGAAVIKLGIAAGVFGIAGNYLGATLFTKGGGKFVKPVMVTVLGIFLVKLVLELAGVL